MAEDEKQELDFEYWLHLHNQAAAEMNKAQQALGVGSFIQPILIEAVRENLRAVRQQVVVWKIAAFRLRQRFQRLKMATSDLGVLRLTDAPFAVQVDAWRS